MPPKRCVMHKSPCSGCVSFPNSEGEFNGHRRPPCFKTFDNKKKVLRSIKAENPLLSQEGVQEKYKLVYLKKLEEWKERVNGVVCVDRMDSVVSHSNVLDRPRREVENLDTSHMEVEELDPVRPPPSETRAASVGDDDGNVRYCPTSILGHMRHANYSREGFTLMAEYLEEEESSERRARGFEILGKMQTGASRMNTNYNKLQESMNRNFAKVRKNEYVLPATGIASVRSFERARDTLRGEPLKSKSAFYRCYDKVREAFTGIFGDNVTRQVQMAEHHVNQLASGVSRSNEFFLGFCSTLKNRLDVMRERKNGKGRYSNQVYSAMQMIANLVHSTGEPGDPRDREIASFLNIPLWRFVDAAKRWPSYVFARWGETPEEKEEATRLFETRGRLRSDRVPEEWKAFMFSEVWHGLTRISACSKETMRNPADRNDKQRYPYHFLECSVQHLYELGVKLGKEHFGEEFHFSYTQFLLLKPFYIKKPRQEQCMCIYCLEMTNIYHGISRFISNRRGTHPCPDDCTWKRPNSADGSNTHDIKNFRDFRAALLCPKPEGSEWYRDSCVLRSCSVCGGANLNLPYCTTHTLFWETVPESDPRRAEMLASDEIDDRGRYKCDYVSVERLVSKSSLRRDGSEKKVKDFAEEFMHVEDVIQLLDTKFPAYIRHHHLYRWQNENWTAQRNPRRGTACSVQDFSQKYTHLLMEEYQSRYFNAISSLLYPVLLFTHLEDRVDIPEEEKVKLRALFNKLGVPHTIRDEILVIGSEKAQDVDVVIHINDKLIHPLLKEIAPEVTVHEGRSDGCKAQFKCARFLLWIANHMKSAFDLRMKWNWYGSCHGKAESDGCGGTFKSAALRYEQSKAERVTKNPRGEDQVEFGEHFNKFETSEDLYEFAKTHYTKLAKTLGDDDNPNRIYKRHVFFIPAAGEGSVNKGFPAAKAPKGITQLHQVDGGNVDDNTFVGRTLSCHCDSCRQGRYNSCMKDKTTVLMKQELYKVTKTETPSQAASSQAILVRDIGDNNYLLSAARSAFAVVGNQINFAVRLSHKGKARAAHEQYTIFRSTSAIKTHRRGDPFPGKHLKRTDFLSKEEDDEFQYVEAVGFIRVNTGSNHVRKPKSGTNRSKCWVCVDDVVAVNLTLELVTNRNEARFPTDPQAENPVQQLKESDRKAIENLIRHVDAVELLTGEEQQLRERTEGCLNNSRCKVLLTCAMTMLESGRVDYETGYACDSFGCDKESSDLEQKFEHCPRCELDFCLKCSNRRKCIHFLHSDAVRSSFTTELLVSPQTGQPGLKCSNLGCEAYPGNICTNTLEVFSHCSRCQVFLCKGCSSARQENSGNVTRIRMPYDEDYGAPIAESIQLPEPHRIVETVVLSDSDSEESESDDEY